MNSSRAKSWIGIFLILLVGVLVLWATSNNNPIKEIGLTEKTNETRVESLIKEGDVSDIYINTSGFGRIRIVGSKIAAKDFPNQADYSFTFGTQNELDMIYDWINEYNDSVVPGVGEKISHTSSRPTAHWFETFYPIFMILIILVGGYFLVRSITNANSKSMSFGKTKSRMAQNVKVKFSDVAGVDEEKEELEEVVEFLKNPAKFTDLGAKIPKGILLVGPPGTGKTLLAKAIAGESNVPFFSISGSDFVEMFVGVGASRVRDLFDQAKKNAPCIIFIDEIDAVGRHRGAGLGGGNDEREQTLNQLLVQMDGFEGNEGVIVLAATNRSDILDPALLRPGRFDRQIHVYPPDVKGREMILKVHAKNKPLDSAIDYKTLARLTSGFTGADIESLLNESAILAAKANRKKITMVDITEGINKVLMGPQKKSRIITEADKRITAFHEAGHAILGKKLKNCDEVQEVSIIPRGMAGGYTLSRPDNDENHLSYNKLMDLITMLLGGRVSEEIEFKEIYTGASNDIQRATEIARKMVTEWGMSDLGPVGFGSSQEIFVGKNYQTQINYSEKKAGEIDEEISKILTKCYNIAKKILTENTKYMRTMVDILLEKETIYQEEVDMIMSGKAKADIIKIMDEREQKTKARVEFERAEADYEKAQKDQATRIKTAEALKNAGVISEEEIIKIKAEAEEIVGTAKLKYEELLAKSKTEEEKDKEKIQEKNQEVSQEKTDGNKVLEEKKSEKAKAEQDDETDSKKKIIKKINEKSKQSTKKDSDDKKDENK